MTLVLGKCRKHGIVGCAECFAEMQDELWKREEESLSKKPAVSSDGQPVMECPLCHGEMRMNMDFQIAKCKNSGCGLLLNWGSVEQRIYSTFRLLEEIMNRRQ